MRILTLICISMIIVSCNQQEKAARETTMSNDSAAAETRPKQKIAEEQLPVTDTGQTWFRVMITLIIFLSLRISQNYPGFLQRSTLQA